MVLQNIAGDDARGSTDEAWDRSQALFETVGEDELIDPAVPPELLLYRLFHEDGVRMFEPKALSAMCRCSSERILSVLKSFSDEEREDMVEDDGVIRVTCEYCSRIYDVAPEEVATPAS
jgi:molecular chaperone Hsp33